MSFYDICTKAVLIDADGNVMTYSSEVYGGPFLMEKMIRTTLLGLAGLDEKVPPAGLSMKIAYGRNPPSWDKVNASNPIMLQPMFTVGQCVTAQVWMNKYVGTVESIKGFDVVLRVSDDELVVVDCSCVER